MGYVGNAPYQGVVDTGNIVDNAVTTSKIAPDTVVAADIAPGAVGTSELADSAVTVPKISASGTPDSTNFLRGDGQWQVVAVTPTAVSDQNNTSTGYFDLPAGTTAQRPGSAAPGFTRYNTTTGSIEFYNGTTWVSTNLTPVINSVFGDIYSGSSSTLTLFLSNATDTVTVRFLEGSTVLADSTGVSVFAGSASVSVPPTVFSQSVGDVITISVFNQDGTPSSNSVTRTVMALPSGGTITTSGNYRIHTFTSSNSLSVPSGFSKSAEYLIVAGGGAGGTRIGGGGGAGGVLSGTTLLSTGNYSIVVGGGGAGYFPSGDANTMYPNVVVNANNGSNSSFNGLTAIGGGGGGQSDGGPGFSGGSGGGGGRWYGGAYGPGSGGSGTSGQGNAGGQSTPASSNPDRSGGGGGAGGVGDSGASSGNGGVGILSSISGSSTYYAGGGGGSVYPSGTPGSGGAGGGGSGSTGDSAGTQGSTNTGGGGGGGKYPNNTGGFSGGSGIVIIRYQL